MPTARPIMEASIGVISATESVNTVESCTPSKPTPTPITAEISGMPAATIEPKVMRRTIPATIRPMTSADMSRPSLMEEKALPEYLAVKPPSSNSLTSFVTASRSAGSISVTPSASKVTLMVPVRSSSERGDRAWRLASICSCGIPWAAICSPICCCMPIDAITGFTMASWSAKTPVSFRSSTKESTSAITCGSVRVVPSGASMTMVPEGSDM